MNRNLLLMIVSLILLAILLTGCLDAIGGLISGATPDSNPADDNTINTIVKYRTGNMTLLTFALILLAKALAIYKLYKDKRGFGEIVKVLVGNIEGSTAKKDIAVKVSKDLAGKQESLVLHKIVKKVT